ncbi:DUF4365 domain-containing protein [Vibrio parahaemolyticus]|uniref:DUF4365 domain-containing protein n=1 Tax=Vibrio parahaemolyticus TaxID=670 RepID=UPI00111EBBB4|nr:DUF4365 domain-containing protein [Vibrio parahaemolyticus]ELE1959066.1 DUF4365 domain-containing protein [Vibrio vulnificus]EIV8655796.1 DUF4365 domain-containing protein [Vibrio parahaemolyticus]EKD9020995.1 DUF4365 domain-containing protein [Vibrio parahaemolyticus]ELA7199872.1 DUF4365 domain-containing protein [Vibrio parahaemolyticus]TOF09017.1 hypothetical protein CGJ29_04510 [Vibrio parahaemolyticus]
MDTPERNHNHVTGEIGEQSAALQFTKWGWTSEKISSDYGEDLACSIFTNNKKTPLYFRAQVKSFYSEKGQVAQLSSGEFSVPIKSSTCLSWAQSFFPVILIVYDSKNDELYWSDITQQVRTKSLELEKERDSISLRVQPNILKDSKAELESSIAAFYSKMLMLNQPEFRCYLVPVLMPEYRALKTYGINGIGELSQPEDMTLTSFGQKSFQDLPGWFSSISSLYPDSIDIYKVHSSTQSLDCFFNDLECLIESSRVCLEPDQWISFIISPVLLTDASSDDFAYPNIWSKTLTEWSCCSLFQGKSFNDYDFAFSVPSSFTRQIATSTRSIQGYFYISPSKKSAVQTYALCNPPYSVIQHSDKFRSLVKKSFTPWQCLEHEVPSLEIMLNELSLVFQILSKDDGLVSGFICEPHFSPEAGGMLLPTCWEEYDVTSVKERILSYAGPIIGEPGKQAIKQSVLSNFHLNSNESKLPLLSMPTDHTLGLPILQDNRELFIHFYFSAHNTFTDTDHSSDIAQLIRNKQLESTPVEVFIRESELSEEVLELCIRIEPAFDISTEEFLLEKESVITNTVFDYLMNLDCDVLDPEEYLRVYGEIYFEGDSPWGTAI